MGPVFNSMPFEVKFSSQMGGVCEVPKMVYAVFSDGICFESKVADFAITGTNFHTRSLAPAQTHMLFSSSRSFP